MLKIVAAILFSLGFAFAAADFDPILRNDLINTKAERKVRAIGKEAREKTGVSLYLIATNEHFPQGFNFYTLLDRYRQNLKAPYVVMVFAPFATIKEGFSHRGRFGLLPSSEAIKKRYDYEAVRDAAIGVVAVKDSNKLEDKVTVGVVQGYSVLADEIAKSYRVQLHETIPDTTSPIVWTLRVLIYTGALAVLWIFIIRPWLRRRNGA